MPDLPASPWGFVLLALAAFWAWETILLIPWRLPSFLQPFLAAGLVFGLLYLPAPLLWAFAGAGAVGLLHTWVGRSAEPVSIQRPRRVNLP